MLNKHSTYANWWTVEMDQSGTNIVHGIFQGGGRGNGKGKFWKPDDGTSVHKHKEISKCFRCNMPRQFACDKSCPQTEKLAKSVDWLVILLFIVVLNLQRSNQWKKREDGAYQIEEEEKRPETAKYAFVVKSSDEKETWLVYLLVGSVELKNVLIDSWA